MKNPIYTLLLTTALLFSYLPQSFAADDKLAIDPAEKMSKEQPVDNLVPPSEIGTLPKGFYSGPGEGDLALEMYRQLLGDTALIATKYFENDQSKRATGGNITVITYLLSIMAVLGMMIGVILTSYWLIIGLVKTNVEGEFMGKKWDSYMVPLRTTFSIVGMQPMPGLGGLSFIQVLVLTIALFGVGVGGAVLKFTTEKTVTAPIVNSINPDYMKFFMSLMDSKICNESFIHKETYGTEYRSVKTKTKEYTIISQNKSYPSYTVKSRKYAIGEDGICGSFQTEISNTNTVNRANPINNMKTQMSNKMNVLLTPVIQKTWVALDGLIGVKGNDDWIFAYDSALDMKETVRSGKQVLLEKIYNDFIADIDKITEEALKLDAADGTRTRQFIDLVGQLGFAYAGSIHYPLLMRSSAIEGAIVAFLPEISINEPSSLWIWGDDVEAYKEFKKYSDSIKHIAEGWIKDRSTYNHFSAMEMMAQVQLGEDPSQALSVFGNGTVSFLSNLFRDIEGHPNPTLEMAAMGRAIQTSAVIWLVGTITISAAGGATDSVPFASALGGAAKPVIALFTTMTYMLLGLAFFYAEIIPAVPYIMWQIAIMGYFMYALATFYAAPMGFAMMNHPDGDDAFGKAGQGFEIIINLALRPSLMIMGFFTGQALLKVISWFINLTFFPTFDAISSNGALGFVSGVGKLAVYGLLMLVAFYKSNSMTWELPSMVASMMGLNQTHRDMGEDEAQQKTLIMAGMLSSNISQLAASAKAPGNKPKEKPSKESE